MTIRQRISVTKIALPYLLGAVLFGWTIGASPQGSLEKGKQMVDAACNSCHPLTARVGTGYDAKGWRTVMRMMVNQGAPVPKDQMAAMTQYLIKTYPIKTSDRAKAAVIKGPLKVSMKSWNAPTPGSRPHDPLAARDGSLWYTGQMANVLGRVDPKTGKVKEYPLKTAHSGPHGLKEDGDGNIWYTGNTASLVGKLNPKTGEVTEYKTPEPGDPHTLLFDKSGILWFTMQNANRIGRLDPKTGEIKLLTPPTPKSRPYGMAFDPKGTLFVVQFGTNSIAAVDTTTMQIKEYKLPDPGARPRRVAATSDGMVWYTDYQRGYLGRLDPATGQVKEWQSPSGPKSAPYGISAIHDLIWYSESEAMPNTVVRFDPKTEKFQSWAIPGGGNIVRNTDVTRDGNFVLANSLVNSVTLVRVPK
jgi:virginiamycin B lyase